MGVFKIPVRRRQTVNCHQLNTRANVSPDRAHVSDRRQQLLYECRSRAQELADILLSNKITDSQTANELAKVDWNQFTYSKELENDRVYDAPALPSQVDIPTGMQNSASQAPLIVVEELDKAVQNTVQEDLPDTPSFFLSAGQDEQELLCYTEKELRLFYHTMMKIQTLTSFVS